MYPTKRNRKQQKKNNLACAKATADKNKNKMKTLKKDWLIWTIILVPYIFVAFFWSKFPDQVPTHFGFDGKPDDYKGKAFGLLFLPTLNICMYFFYLALPLIDPSKKNYGLFQDKFKIIRMVVHAFLTFVFFITAVYSLGYIFNISMLIYYGVLVLFLLMGNNIGNVRHNYFIGVRTPWTLANEEVWTRTHRMAAKLWVAASLIAMVVLPFVPQEATSFVFMGYVVLISLIPIIYSYIEFKKTVK